MTKVFAVQGAIARRVTEALSVALAGDSGPGRLAELARRSASEVRRHHPFRLLVSPDWRGSLIARIGPARTGGQAGALREDPRRTPMVAGL